MSVATSIEVIPVHGFVYDVHYDEWRLWFRLFDNIGDRWVCSVSIEDWMPNWLLTEDAKFTVWLTREQAYATPLKATANDMKAAVQGWKAK